MTKDVFAGMRPNSIAMRILRVLAEGPATSGEIVALTSLSGAQVRSHLPDLARRKKVTRQHFSGGKGKGIGGPLKYLWRIAQ